jgi:prenyltransferase beta subunit
MKLPGIFSKTIFRFLAGRSFRRIRTNSIETVLARSVRLIDPMTVAEIITYIKSQQTNKGGFADRGGNCDVYYSLFGCYIAEALGIDEIKPLLKEYVKTIVISKKLTGVHLKCAVILYIKLFGSESLPSTLRKREPIQALYSDFINLLADYYSENYFSLILLKLRLRKTRISDKMPCSVAAAHMILNNSSGKKFEEPWKLMSGFYKEGGFSAFQNIPHGDMLSTGVALYALRFINANLGIIKPECLVYIDRLYSEGGFCATSSDPEPDVEYTFYGLLALGALSD